MNKYSVALCLILSSCSTLSPRERCVSEVEKSFPNLDKEDRDALEGLLYGLCIENNNDPKAVIAKIRAAGGSH